MDFLSTPLPKSSGCEITVEKKRYGWAKGIKQTAEWIKKRSEQRRCRIFEGKSVDQWEKILSGDKGEIRKHIKNGTMEEYATYREWKDGVRPKRTINIKHRWQGKSVSDWQEILGGDRGMILKHIKNGTMEEYATYREWKDGVRVKRKMPTIKFMTPKGLMGYEEAKTAFSCSVDSLRRRLQSDSFPDWYFVKEAQE